MSDSLDGKAATLLSRLERVTQTGEGRYLARCPAHEDRSPSLSIRNTGERILIHCFAGCAAEDVLTAIDMTWSDIYPDKWECARKRPNEGAAAHVRRTLASRPWPDLEHERLILKIAAADIKAGKTLSTDDKARVEVARQRIARSKGK